MMTAQQFEFALDPLIGVAAAEPDADAELNGPVDDESPPVDAQYNSAGLHCHGYEPEWAAFETH